MAAKIIKEIIILLLTVLLAMLIFAVVLYEYIPNRKVVPEVVEYKASEKVSEQLADKVDQKDDDIVLTYEVTASDLNNYKITKDYVPGKSNPFAAVSQDPEVDATTSKDGKDSTSKSGNKTSGSSNSGTSNSQDDEISIK